LHACGARTRRCLCANPSLRGAVGNPARADDHRGKGGIGSLHLLRDQRCEAFVHAVSGTAGGAAAMTLFYPLDLIRTFNQVDNTSILKLIQDEGLGVLYRGLSGVLISLGVSNFVYFYTNNLLKVFLRKITDTREVSVVQNLFIASLAGVVNVLLTCPLWVANTRLKLQTGSGGHGHGAKPAEKKS